MQMNILIFLSWLADAPKDIPFEQEIEVSNLHMQSPNV
jgi:hypothetical protein